MPLKPHVDGCDLIAAGPVLSTQCTGGFGKTFGDGASLNFAPAYPGDDGDLVDWRYPIPAGHDCGVWKKDAAAKSSSRTGVNDGDRLLTEISFTGDDVSIGTLFSESFSTLDDIERLAAKLCLPVPLLSAIPLIGSLELTKSAVRTGR